MASAIDQINNILRRVEIDAPSVQGLALVSWEGLMISSVLQSDIDETIVSAMASTLQGLGEQASMEFSSGSLETVFVRGESGYILIKGIGDTGVLLMLARGDAKLGVLIYSLEKASKELQKIL